MENIMNKINKAKLANLSNSLKGIQNKIPLTQSITTSQRIAKIVNKKTKLRKKTITKKSAVRRMTIDVMFKDRTNPNLGLKKIEVLSEYLNQSKQQILKMTKEEINSEYKKFKKITKALRKEGYIAIISKPLEIGHSLYDIPNGQWGNRVLSKREYVSFKCTTNNDALKYRGEMDKIKKGVEDCGNDVVNITQSHQKNKQIIKLVNGGKNANKNK